MTSCSFYKCKNWGFKTGCISWAPKFFTMSEVKANLNKLKPRALFVVFLFVFNSWILLDLKLFNCLRWFLSVTAETLLFQIDISQWLEASTSVVGSGLKAGLYFWKIGTLPNEPSCQMFRTFFFLKDSFCFTAKLKRRYRKLPFILIPVSAQSVPSSASVIWMIPWLQVLNLVCCSVHSCALLSLDRYMMTYLLHYRITQNIFTALKILPVHLPPLSRETLCLCP